MAISDGHGLPLAIHVTAASPHETRLIDATLAACFTKALPARLIGDRAYDSDRLDTHLRDHCGIEMIAVYRPNRRVITQDGLCVAVAGRSNASLPGFITLVASSRAGNVTQPTFSG